MRKNVEKSVEKQIRPPRNVVVKAGVWYVRKSVKQVDGQIKQYWRVCHQQTPAAAAAILAEIEKDLNNYKAGRVEHSKLIREIIKRFIADEVNPAVIQGDKKISGRISCDTVLAILKRLDATFGHREADTITFGDIHSYKNERVNTPVVFLKSGKARQRSIRSVNYDLIIFRQIFNYLIARREIARSPFKDGKGLIDTSLETKRHVTWTREEEAKALAFCVGNRYAHMKPIIILITDGGFRMSELLKARWSDIDYEGGFILARSFKGKSLSTRRIYLTDRAIAALVEWNEIKKTLGRKAIDDDRIIGMNRVQNAWETIRENINRPDLRLHDLRHVFATRLSGNNVPVPVIGEMLGHSNITTTQRYINPHSDELREAMRTLQK